MMLSIILSIFKSQTKDDSKNIFAGIIDEDKENLAHAALKIILLTDDFRYGNTVTYQELAPDQLDSEMINEQFSKMTNTDIKFYTVYRGNYENEITKLYNSGAQFDAFQIYNYNSFIDTGIAMDITNIVAKNAPVLF